jgi:hypothetical protein
VYEAVWYSCARMVRRNADAPLVVEVPPAGADRPSWGRVGVITAIGFIVGVAWPRLAGVRLGPSVPEAPSSSAAASPSGAAAGPPSAGAVSVLPSAVAVAPASSQPAAAVAPAADVSATHRRHGGHGDSSPGPEAKEAEDAAAQVTWEVAIIRDAPKTGKVLARLQRGTAIRVGAAKDGWYPVKYGEGFASDGWVYRGAIGR